MLHKLAAQSRNHRHRVARTSVGLRFGRMAGGTIEVRRTPRDGGKRTQCEDHAR